MTDRDQNNLDYIRKLYDQGGTDLERWLQSISDEDFQYAIELLAAWERELTAETEEFDVESQIEVLGDYPEANTVLKQFRLTR